MGIVPVAVIFEHFNLLLSRKLQVSSLKCSRWVCINIFELFTKNNSQKRSLLLFPLNICLTKIALIQCEYMVWFLIVSTIYYVDTYLIRSQEKNLNQNRDSKLGPPDF